MRSRLPLASVLFVAVCAGCAGKEPPSEPPEIAALERDLAREFHSAVPEVELEDSTTLKITFNDPGLVGSQGRESRVTADRVKDYVRDNFSRYGQLSTIEVAFESSRSLGPVKLGRSERTVTSTDRPGPTASESY